jgi:hypothetical protein
LIQAALLGGVFIGVLSALPVINLANCCCIWIMAGGALAAYIDQAPGRTAGVARGALDGLLAGIVGTFVWLLASMAIDVVLAPLQERMLTAVLEAPAEMPPQAREWLEEMRTGGPFRYVIGFMFQLFAGMIFGMLGGLLGALFFWREGLPPAIGGPPPIPPSY